MLEHNEKKPTLLVALCLWYASSKSKIGEYQSSNTSRFPRPKHLKVDIMCCSAVPIEVLLLHTRQRNLDSGAQKFSQFPFPHLHITTATFLLLITVQLHAAKVDRFLQQASTLHHCAPPGRSQTDRASVTDTPGTSSGLLHGAGEGLGFGERQHAGQLSSGMLPETVPREVPGGHGVDEFGMHGAEGDAIYANLDLRWEGIGYG